MNHFQQRVTCLTCRRIRFLIWPHHVDMEKVQDMSQIKTMELNLMESENGMTREPDWEPEAVGSTETVAASVESNTELAPEARIIHLEGRLEELALDIQAMRGPHVRHGQGGSGGAL